MIAIFFGNIARGWLINLQHQDGKVPCGLALELSKKMPGCSLLTDKTPWSGRAVVTLEAQLKCRLARHFVCRFLPTLPRPRWCYHHSSDEPTWLIP
jgi:hypothetical protein